MQRIRKRNISDSRLEGVRVIRTSPLSVNAPPAFSRLYFALLMAIERLIVGISGASGAILGIRLLEALRHAGIETHLIISPAARRTIPAETGWSVADVERLADVVHPVGDLGASIASGSFQTDGMAIVPCSVRTISAVAYGLTDDLISRAADVCLKEGRPVVAVFREAPLHLGHLRALTQFAECGGIVFPPVPAFYAGPATLDDVVNQLVGRILDRLGVPNTLVRRWTGLSRGQAKEGGAGA